MSRSRMLVLLLTAALMAGCVATPVTGSGNVVTVEKAIIGFDKVDISDAFEVAISRGEAFSVLVRVDDNLVEYLRVVKQGSTLHIGLRSEVRARPQGATLEAEITMPQLTRLDLSGSSDVTITGFSSTKALEADLSGSSDLRGDIEAGNVRLDLSGGSSVTLSGSGRDAAIDASGGSDVNLAEFSVADANVDLSGGSDVTVNAGGRLDVDASGGSRVTYVGSPTLGRMDLSGASSVERRWGSDAQGDCCS